MHSFLRHYSVCPSCCSLPCCLIRLREPSDYWPRNKRKISQWIQMETSNRIRYNPRMRLWRRTQLECENHSRWRPRVWWTVVSIILTLQASDVSSLHSWAIFLLPWSALVVCFSNKNMKSFKKEVLCAILTCYFLLSNTHILNSELKIHILDALQNK